MKRAVILHGTQGSPDINWFRWLERQLRRRGMEVWVPALPNADQPSLREWSEYVRKECPFTMDDETLLIGHSSGAILALIISQDYEPILGGIVAVSVFCDNSLEWEPNDRLFDVQFDFDEIKRGARNFLFVHSDNDPYVPMPKARFMADNCGSSLLIVPGQGHFNTEHSDGYRQFPELIRLMRERHLL